MNGIIYSATFDNGRIYVGQTTQNLNDRIAQHYWYAENNKDNFIFHRAIRKYGRESIKWEILEDNIQDIVTLNKREIYWIKEKNSYNGLNRKGCNMTPGGDERQNLFRFTKADAIKMAERYKETGKSTEVGKEFNCTPSVAMKYIKMVLPNYKDYSYGLKGHQSIFTEKEKQEIYNYYILTGSFSLTLQKFDCAEKTLQRVLSSIDDKYFTHAWHFAIPKQEAYEIFEDFKKNGRLEPYVKKYGVKEKAIRNLFKAIDPNYTQYTKKKNRK